MASDLPQGWEQRIDNQTKQSYYVNIITNEKTTHDPRLPLYPTPTPRNHFSLPKPGHTPVLSQQSSTPQSVPYQSNTLPNPLNTANRSTPAVSYLNNANLPSQSSPQQAEGLISASQHCTSSLLEQPYSPPQKNNIVAPHKPVTYHANGVYTQQNVTYQPQTIQTIGGQARNVVYVQPQQPAQKVYVQQGGNQVAYNVMSNQQQQPTQKIYVQQGGNQVPYIGASNHQQPTQMGYVQQGGNQIAYNVVSNQQQQPAQMVYVQQGGNQVPYIGASNHQQPTQMGYVQQGGNQIAYNVVSNQQQQPAQKVYVQQGGNQVPYIGASNHQHPTQMGYVQQGENQIAYNVVSNQQQHPTQKIYVQQGGNQMAYNLVSNQHQQPTQKIYFQQGGNQVPYIGASNHQQPTQMGYVQQGGNQITYNVVSNQQQQPTQKVYVQQGRTQVAYNLAYNVVTNKQNNSYPIVNSSAVVGSKAPAVVSQNPQNTMILTGQQHNATTQQINTIPQTTGINVQGQQVNLKVLDPKTYSNLFSSNQYNQNLVIVGNNAINQPQQIAIQQGSQANAVQLQQLNNSLQTSAILNQQKQLQQLLRPAGNQILHQRPAGPTHPFSGVVRPSRTQIPLQQVNTSNAPHAHGKKPSKPGKPHKPTNNPNKPAKQNNQAQQQTQDVAQDAAQDNATQNQNEQNEGEQEAYEQNYKSYQEYEDGIDLNSITGDGGGLDMSSILGGGGGGGFDINSILGGGDDGESLAHSMIMNSITESMSSMDIMNNI
ncbi:20025_t:CDS:2 [Funneliformis geosporum]|nr:20025_t:CDS:2 [Funneliformis geosporum]